MKKKNIVAAVIMTGVLVLSIPLGVNRSLSKVRDEAMGDYYYDSTGFAVYDGLETRVDTASNLLSLAEKYKSGNESLMLLCNDLEGAIHVCKNTEYEDFQAEAEANQKLGEAAEALAEALKQEDLSERDAKYPDSLMSLMRSEQDKIERSSYNDKAREYNAMLEAFPVNILRYPAGLAPLGVFQ
jgi:hypothetical protein